RHIRPRNLESKVEIVKRAAERERIDLPPDVGLFIANKIKSNALDLEGSLQRLVAYASSKGLPISLNLAKEVLNSHIIGFGVAKERKFRIPWRQSDTVYFDCSGAISLPEFLPDGQAVERAVRRIYLDAHALVRFEFIVFASAKHRYVEYPLTDEFARDFWRSALKVKLYRTKTEATFATAIPQLLNKFVAMTSLHYKGGSIRFDLVRRLEPQLQVIAEVSPAELEDLNPQYVSDATKIALTFRSLKMDDWPTPIDSVFITHPRGL